MSKESRQSQRNHARLIVAKYHKKKTYWTENEFRSVVTELHPEIIIKDDFCDMDTKLTCYCTKDFNSWLVKPRDIVNDGTGCPTCARRDNGRKYSEATKGVDDIATNYPHLVKYFINENEASFYKCQSNMVVKLRCPYCHTERNMPIYSLTTRGFNCSVCGDGVSYPNKIGRMMVLQLPAHDIEFEWHPTWIIGKSRFDIKFEYDCQIYVVEMDGYQHYVEDISFTHRCLSEIQKEDKIKNDLCEKNNIIMIRINCRDNSLKWIRDNIINSELKNVFDLSIIDWKKCDMYAADSFIIKTGELWNKGLDLLQISQELKVSRSTVQRYIKIADNIGLCQYDKNRGMVNGVIKNSHKIRWIDRNEEFINSRICAEEVFRQTGIKVSLSGIRAVANGYQNHTKGFTFEYCDKNS